MVKKVIFLLVTLAIVSSYSASFGTSFETMTENESATFLAENDIIKDYGNDWEKYRYQDGLTRGEGLKIFMKISGKKIEDKCDGIFSDLKSGWQCKYVEAALRNGFISKNDKFRPNDNFTKTEVAKLITKVKGVEKVVETDNWQNDYMLTLYEYGIIKNKYTDYNADAKRGWIFQIATSTIKKEEEIKKIQVEKKKTMSDETM
ncbi:hypothetical protein CSB07_01775 [Candidatus Gracilibacteria bacterium]|nr:MAG: hypothetical protein CSB07_01775 [Candidatus Gracilibacteria bacterium]PIE85199.1 MAG: hypothetical protein CSA08_02985 [Candidatus Gracilibacteria bacterium]